MSIKNDANGASPINISIVKHESKWCKSRMTARVRVLKQPKYTTIKKRFICLIREYLVLFLFFCQYRCIFEKYFGKNCFHFYMFFTCILRVICALVYIFRYAWKKRPDFTRVFHVFWCKKTQVISVFFTI